MAKLSSTLVVEPFGKIEIFSDADGLRVKAGIRMKPAVEGAQTGLAIDGSNSMKKMFGADLPPFMPRNNLIEAVARSMAEALADFDTDGNTSVIYWACGVGGRWPIWRNGSPGGWRRPGWRGCGWTPRSCASRRRCAPATRRR